MSSSADDANAAAAAMPPPSSPPWQPIVRRLSSSGASRNSPFTPRARQTALGRLPKHLLSFEDLSDDEENDNSKHEPGQKQQQQAPAQGASIVEASPSPKAATATALRTWGDASNTHNGGSSSSGFTLRAEDLEFHSRIAEGAYGVVWRARLRPGWQRRRRRASLSSSTTPAAGPGADAGDLEEGRAQEVAVKVQRVPPGEEDEQVQANLLIELSVLQGLVHPRLVRYHGAALMSEAEAQANPEWRPLLVPPGGGQQIGEGEVEEGIIPGEEEAKAADDAAAATTSAAAADEQQQEPMLVLMVMEYCVRGSLRQALSPTSSTATSPVILSWLLRVRIAVDIADGLAFLHAHGLLHRDLKTSNVLLDRQWRAKLCDHSFATATHSPDLAAFACGTDEFLAPEAALGEPPGYDKPCDVFSLGVVLCELITGKEPGCNGFLCRSARDLFQLDAAEVEAVTPEVCPPSLLMLALQCAQNGPGDRPTAEEACEWAASLLGELGGGEGAGVGVELLPAEGCFSPLPWVLPEEEEQAEVAAGEQEDEVAVAPAVAAPPLPESVESVGGGKARPMSWAAVARRGMFLSDSSSSCFSLAQQRAQQQEAHGHKRAFSSTTAAGEQLPPQALPAVEGSGGGHQAPSKRMARDEKPLALQVQQQMATLPGLLGDRGNRRGRRDGGKAGGGQHQCCGGGQRRRGERGQKGRSGRRPQPEQQPTEKPQQQQQQQSSRICGRAGSFDNFSLLSLSTSREFTTTTGGRSKPLPPASFAAAVQGGDGKAKTAAAETLVEVDALVQGLEGVRLQPPPPSSSSSPPQAPQEGRSAPANFEPVADMLEQRMAQAYDCIRAQLDVVRREFRAAETEEEVEKRRRMESVRLAVEELERVVKEDIMGAVAVVKEVRASLGRVRE